MSLKSFGLQETAVAASRTALIAELRALVEGDGSFLAVKLDKPSRKALMKWWVAETGQALLPNVHANHVTLKFEPSASDLEGVELGAEVEVKVVRGTVEHLKRN